MTSEPSKRGGTAFMLRASAYLGLLCQLAEELKQKFDIRTVLIANSPQDIETFQSMGHDPSIFADVIYCDATEMEALECRPPDEKELQAEIRRVESAYGIRLIDSIRADRLYGMGFVTGARTMGTPFMRTAKYSQLLTVAVRVADFMGAIIRQHNPDVVIGYPGTLASNLLIEIARHHGIPMRGLSAPRRAHYFYWTADRYGLPAHFDRQFGEILQKLEADGTACLSKDETQVGWERPEQATRAALARGGSLTVRALIRGVISHSVSSFSYVWFQHPRRRMLYTYRDRLVQFARAWFDNRRSIRERPLLPRLDVETPYVFFPLHFEPEASLLSDAVDSPSQLAIIDWLARGAPSGWRVIVKEHPIQAPRRPVGFWEAVRRYPNLLVASKFESGEALMEKATVVAVINGTLGLQAAERMKPVISFHRDYVGKVLPQIHVVESFSAVKQCLADVSTGKITPSGRWVAAQEAWRQTWALHEFRVTASEFYEGHPVRTRIPSHEMELLTGHLMKSLLSEPQQL